MTIFRFMAGALMLATAALSQAAAEKSIESNEQGTGYSLEFSYPAVIAEHPALQQMVLAERQTQLTQLKQWGKDWVSENPERAVETDMESFITWQTVANLPRFLSLTKDIWDYSGGAHGNWWRSSIVWDKQLGTVRKPIEMFVDKQAFDRVMHERFCEALDTERARKDGQEPVAGKDDAEYWQDWMERCPKPSELDIILGSSDRKTFNRLAVYVGIYTVGPYVEGDYEIDLPVTANLIAAVKPEYRGVFAVSPKSAAKARER